MPGEVATTEEGQQAVWDDVAKEREAGEPPSTPTAKPPEEPKAEAPPPEAAPATDPFEGLSPELKARLAKVDQLEAAIAVIPQLQQTLRTAEGRVAAMQREIDVAKNTAKAVQDAPSHAQIKAASGDTQKWTSLKQDFPEWADATEQFVRSELAGLTPPPAQSIAPEEVERIVQQRTGETRDQLTRQIEEAKVEGKYENWLEDINSKDFATWLPLQTPELQALASSNKGRDAIKLLDAYKQTVKAPAVDVQQSREEKLAAAVTNRPNSSAPTGKTVDQMTPKELWDYEAKRAAKRDQGLTY